MLNYIQVTMTVRSAYMHVLQLLDFSCPQLSVDTHEADTTSTGPLNGNRTNEQEES